MIVEYHPAVEEELHSIITYYNGCAHGLGNEFLDEFDRQALKITAMPDRWPPVKNGIRRALMKRFPYVIYFRTVGKEIVRITVVKHQRRHPTYGLDRS